MKEVLTLLLGLSFTFLTGGRIQEASHPDKTKLVHLVVINMSGSSRVLHHGNDIVPLPVATQVPIQIPAGDQFKVTSETDSRVEIKIAVKVSDEGQLLPIR